MAERVDLERKWLTVCNNFLFCFMSGVKSAFYTRFYTNRLRKLNSMERQGVELTAQLR